MELRNCLVRENLLSRSHILLMGLNKFISVLSKFTVGFAEIRYDFARNDLKICEFRENRCTENAKFLLCV